MGGVLLWLVSIGSPGLAPDAADDGKIGILFAICGLNPWELFAKGLLFNGSPTEAIESLMYNTPVYAFDVEDLRLLGLLR